MEADKFGVYATPKHQWFMSNHKLLVPCLQKTRFSHHVKVTFSNYHLFRQDLTNFPPFRRRPITKDSPSQHFPPLFNSSHSWKLDIQFFHHLLFNLYFPRLSLDSYDVSYCSNQITCVTIHWDNFNGQSPTWDNNTKVNAYGDALNNILQKLFILYS